MARFWFGAAALLWLGGTALADPIEGEWRTKTGATATISPCGGAFCIVARDGKHPARSIGRMTADGGGSYSGEITDPKNDKTYSGNAKLSGNRLKLSGCVLGGSICRGENWSRL